MWEWLIERATIYVKALFKGKHSIFTVDEVVSEVTQALLQNQELAKEIYDSRDNSTGEDGVKSKSYLYGVCKRVLYGMYAKQNFDNQADYYRYQMIMEVCEKYAIPALPCNAYKISAIMQSKYGRSSIKKAADGSVKREFVYSIQNVQSILNNKKHSEIPVADFDF